MNLSTLTWRTGPLVFCLALAGWQLAARADQEPPPPLPPVEQQPTDDKQPVVVAPVSTLPYTVPLLDPSMTGVFAPYTGKAPCGEFDDPNNNYFGDARIYRSLILGQLWVSGEYLAWDMKGVRLPPLVTTSAIGTPAADAGALDTPGTATLFGDEVVHDKIRSGARINFGYWFSAEHTAGLEFDFFWLDGQNINALFDSADIPILAHPILNNGVPDRFLVAYPGVQTAGATNIRSDMGLFGLETLWRVMIECNGNQRLDAIGGYRHMRLFDRLRTDDAFTDDATGTDVLRTDLFESRNDFHGGEFGLVYRWWNCCWALQATGKAAIGGTHTFTSVDGETVETLNGVDTVTAAGILAQPTNIGGYSRNTFAAVGELGVRAEYAATPQLRFMVGYNILWWSKVARVPNAINLESSRLAFVDTNFWAHGLSVGGYYDF